MSDPVNVPRSVFDQLVEAAAVAGRVELVPEARACLPWEPDPEHVDLQEEAGVARALVIEMLRRYHAEGWHLTRSDEPWFDAYQRVALRLVHAEAELEHPWAEAQRLRDGIRDVLVQASGAPPAWWKNRLAALIDQEADRG